MSCDEMDWLHHQFYSTPTQLIHYFHGVTQTLRNNLDITRLTLRPQTHNPNSFPLTWSDSKYLKSPPRLAGQTRFTVF